MPKYVDKKGNIVKARRLDNEVVRVKERTPTGTRYDVLANGGDWQVQKGNTISYIDDLQFRQKYGREKYGK